jgi:hypothetical protein
MRPNIRSRFFKIRSASFFQIIYNNIYRGAKLRK